MVEVHNPNVMSFSLPLFFPLLFEEASHESASPPSHTLDKIDVNSCEAIAALIIQFAKCNSCSKNTAKNRPADQEKKKNTAK